MPKILSACIMLMLAAMPAFAYEYDEAGERARQAHNLAVSDVIYEQENFKALYYQNVQIISLLKDIRDLMERQMAAEKA